MIDLAALERTCAELRQQPDEDQSGQEPRTVVGLSFLERALEELRAGRDAHARLGQVFGLPEGQRL
mgnify:CR=1 FL=1|tara:strand:+ start:7445 stop:7642 length:198 start_codon:yes stop_codon:yes gene_type:complete